jgi:hypothetical protein
LDGDRRRHATVEGAGPRCDGSARRPSKPPDERVPIGTPLSFVSRNGRTHGYEDELMAKGKEAKKEKKKPKKDAKPKAK